MSPLLHISWRAPWRRGERWRTCALIIATAVATISCLVASAIPTVADHELDRARRPIADRAVSDALIFESVNNYYRGHTVTIVQTAALRDDAPPPPGLDRFPGVDEAFVSPALMVMLEDDATLRSWFPEQIRVLPPVAVGSAGQLLAYIGVSEDAFVRAPGNPMVNDRVDAGFARDRPSQRIVMLGLLLFCVIPALALAAVATRLGNDSQRERTRALRLLGVPRAAAAAVSGLACIIPAALGTAIGTAAFAGLVHATDTLPVVHRRFFAIDVDLPAGLVAIVAAAVIVFVAAVAMVPALSSARLGKTTRPLLSSKATSAWMLIPVAIALLMLLVAALRRRPNDPVLTAAIVLFGIGLPAATVFSTQQLARRLATRRVPVPALLALRKLEQAPVRALRIAGVAAVGVYAVCAAQPFTQVFASGTAVASNAVRPHDGDLLVGRVVGVSGIPPRLETPPPGVDMVLPVVPLRDPSQPDAPAARALVATCEQLQQLTQALIDGCTGEAAHIRIGASRSSPSNTDTTLTLVGDDGTAVTFPSPATAITIPTGEQTTGVAQLLIPPDDPHLAAAEPVSPTGAVVAVANDEDAWLRAQAWIVRANPAYRLENSLMQPDPPSRAGLWLALGIVTASATIAVAGAIVTLDATSSRGRELRSLRALGLRRISIVAAQATEGVIAATLAIGAALLGSLASAAVYWHMQRDDPFPSIGPYLQAGSIGFTAVIGISLVVGIASTRPVGAPGVRRTPRAASNRTRSTHRVVPAPQTRSTSDSTDRS